MVNIQQLLSSTYSSVDEVRKSKLYASNLFLYLQLIQESDQLKHKIESNTKLLNSSINVFHHQLSKESQQLNSSINMFHHQLSQEIENEIKQLNSSINSQLNEKCPALENYTEHLTTA